MMPINIPALLLSSWIISALLMLWAWFFQRARRNAAIVDIAWYLSFALVAVGYAVATTGDPNRRLLVAIMAGTWGLRLAGYLYLDRILDKSEDARYQRIRRWFGKRAQGYFFLLFQGEALAIPVFSLPLLVLMQNSRPDFSLWEWAGVVLWMVALAGEWQADRQLVAFRAKPENQGKVCREGLWRYSRHPNYFFESLHWWAYVLMAIGLPYAWVTVVAPIGMTVTLLWITGIPLTEAQALVTRGEEYREYQRTTSAFIPWFPKNT